MSKVIIGCEESQAVTIELRLRGVEAYSCDIKPCTGPRPQWHIQDDIFYVLKKENWKGGIFFPPCTFLTITANSWLNIELYGERARQRHEDRLEAALFFMRLYNYPLSHIAIENPVGFFNSIIPPTQIIHPYYFGNPYQKQTCLWLQNLPPLQHFKEVDLFNQTITHTKDKGEFVTWVNKKGKKKRQPKWFSDLRALSKEERSELRSKTFPGVAQAMAEQWSIFFNQ